MNAIYALFLYQIDDFILSEICIYSFNVKIIVYSNKECASLGIKKWYKSLLNDEESLCII